MKQGGGGRRDQNGSKFLLIPPQVICQHDKQGRCAASCYDMQITLVYFVLLVLELLVFAKKKLQKATVLSLLFVI